MSVQTRWQGTSLRKNAVAAFLLTAFAFASAATAQNPVPLINQPLVPDAVKPGAPRFTLTVHGTGFVSGAVVKWNGSARTTTFVSSSKLTAAILASDVAKPVTVAVRVTNPTPGGGTSNPAFFEVTPSSSTIALNTPIGLAAGSGPLSVAVGDFNGDGKLDLAVTNGSSNNVSILLGNGDGSFQTHVDYPTGAQPTSVEVGDFNGDGKLDLAITNQNCALVPCGPGSLSILLGKGDGTFEPAVNYATGSAPYGVAVADFNRDGKQDLVVANSNESDISVLLGNGDGTFQTEVKYNTGSIPNPAGVAVGDFNGDGHLDLAVADFACPGGAAGCGSVSVLLGNGDGTFKAAVNYAAGAQPISIAVGDFNRDGKLDLAVANNSNSSVSVLLGNGDGTFKAAVNYSVPSDAVSVAVGDFNGDGKLDLAVAVFYSTCVSVFLGKGDGTFAAGVNYVAGTNPNSIALGDFNGDGRIDVAVADSGGTLVSLLLQTPIVSLSNVSLTFASQLLGTSSASQTVTLSNPSGLALRISSIALTGADGSDFSQSNTCASGLPPGGTCQITVTFTPQQVGPRTASVTITDNAAGSPHAIALSGTGIVSGPDATLSPTSLTFAAQLVGTTSTAQTVTLTDYGTAAVSITRIGFTGADPGDYHQTATCGTSLAAGASCTINVTFQPTLPGSRTAILSVKDNAPGSPQTASVSGTGSVVKLVPTSLSFSCHDEPKTCPPPPQSIALTNVGGATLHISSIAITGSNAFTQTNTCGSTVGAGKSCTISVTFNSSSRGTFTGAVSISDNGGASPQQVSLTGLHTKTTSISSVVRSALANTRTAAVPKPTGPNPVGTRVMSLIDLTRANPFLANGTNRELLVRFWYPASLNQGCDPAEYTSPKVWTYFSQIAEIPLPQVRTNSCLDAPITDGAHPVVVFSHGYTATFTDYTFLFEDLASRGYLVVSIDHTYEATAVAFPDGRFVKSVFGSYLAKDSLRNDEKGFSFATRARLRDVKFVVDELGRLNRQEDNPFTGKVDESRVAIAGHSLGALTALLSLEREPRFAAGILIDGNVPDLAFREVHRPVLMLTMGREQWTENECRLWSQLRGGRVAVDLRSAEHLTPSDAVWLAKGAIQTEAAGPEGTIAAIRDYIAAFLDTKLRQRALGPPLRDPSAVYPDAVVRMEDQRLCEP